MRLPNDPVLLDVLGMIEVRSGGYWHWKGLRNNKGLATVRFTEDTNVEKSVVRYLAVRFGLIEPDDNGLLYPTHETDDVNPWHRVLRPSAAPIGRNAVTNRFAKAAS